MFFKVFAHHPTKVKEKIYYKKRNHCISSTAVHFVTENPKQKDKEKIKQATFHTAATFGPTVPEFIKVRLEGK